MLNKTKVYSVQLGKILALILVKGKKNVSLTNFVDKKFSPKILDEKKLSENPLDPLKSFWWWSKINFTQKKIGERSKKNSEGLTYGQFSSPYAIFC